MNVSFEGIGQWCATFSGTELPEGSVVKVSGAGEVSACEAGDAFCGAVAAGKKDACTVQLGGFVTVGYSGTAAPAIGYTALEADGEGGVKAVEAAAGGSDGTESSAAGTSAAAAGRSYWVVDRDETAKTVTILL